MTFEKFFLKKELLEQLQKNNFLKATIIQEKCIPIVLKKKDLIGQSLTGSGKTLAFVLPILNNLSFEKKQVLVLTPTRELALQVKEVFDEFGKKMNFNTSIIHGGLGYDLQKNNVNNSQIIVATPGRLIDHLNKKNFDLNNIKIVVLDEMDRMLDIGFEKDVHQILKQIPKNRQTIMFSATMRFLAKKIAQKYLKNPVHIKSELKVNNFFLKQIVYKIPKEKRFSLLVHLLKEKKGISIVFCRTKRDVDKLSKNLRKNNLFVAPIHGDIKQHQRNKAIQDFKENKLDALIATDVASRGLDIKNVTHVYNYEIPKEIDDYTHRIGRTARAGQKGDAITFITEHDNKMFKEILKNYNNLVLEKLPVFEQIIFEKNKTNNFSNKKTKNIKKHYKNYNNNEHSIKKPSIEKNYSEKNNHNNKNTNKTSQNKNNYIKKTRIDKTICDNKKFNNKKRNYKKNKFNSKKFGNKQKSFSRKKFSKKNF